MRKLEILSVTPDQLVSELKIGNPVPEEKWFQRDDFDPTYGAAELRAAAKRGLIELETNENPALWRFRLTTKGREYDEKI